MRIDLNPKNPEIQESGNAARGSVPKKGTASESAIQDEAQFSSYAARRSALEKHVNDLPEIRAEKVDALRAAVQSGRYQVSPAKIADALFSAMMSPA